MHGRLISRLNALEAAHEKARPRFNAGVVMVRTMLGGDLSGWLPPMADPGSGVADLRGRLEAAKGDDLFGVTREWGVEHGARL